MKLKKLLKDVNVLYADKIKNININHISISTQDIKPNTLFVCLKGENFDSHNFKEYAMRSGCVAFIVEKYDKNFDGLQIVVQSSRLALSLISRNFFKFKKSVKIIGITGTNGKTTTTYILASILKCANKQCGIIGTEGVVYNNKKINFNMTTPDPILLFSYLKLMAEEGIEYVVMEVSAHAIFYEKIAGINFFVKGLTNISNDHLDFFDTKENYAKTKIDFISQGNCIKVINLEDESADKLLINKKTYSYAKGDSADVFAYDFSTDYSTYTLNIFDKPLYINTNLVGAYNVENVLLACTIAHLIGIKEKFIIDGLKDFNGVEGRMNVYKKGKQTAIIDFAHTPDALEKVLKTVRQITQGKLYCLFGCGGNRDVEKRKQMGEISAKLCDYVFITSDNPRFERAEDIANDIASGIKTSNYEIILDRQNAIKQATLKLNDGDVLMLCGKGSESYIEINGVKHSYSEKQELSKWGFKN